MPGTTDDRERVNEACQKLGTYIPNDLSLYFWPLPLIEKIIDRIDDLAMGLDDLRSRLEGSREDDKP